MAKGDWAGLLSRGSSTTKDPVVCDKELSSSQSLKMGL